jgi:small-conductance mechanosensitive channel
MKHSAFIDNRSDEDKLNDLPSVVVRVINLGDFSVDLRAWVWTIDNGSGYVLKTDLYKLVKQRFDREGIEIPFPYRTVVFKKDLKNKNIQDEN